MLRMKRCTEVVLNNGQKMPTLGLGTWKSAPSQVEEAVKVAIDVGYRHIDCAFLYKNEHEVGAALKTKFDENVLKRENIFITTKLWNTFHNPKDVAPAFEDSLKNLGLDYVDLYLMHFPMAYKNLGPGIFMPEDDKGNRLNEKTDYMETWRAMEKLLESGKVKSLGVSNFNGYQLKRVLREGNIVPAVNQVECHPYLSQSEMIKLCKLHDIVMMGYSPFGSPDRYWASPDEPRLLEEPKIIEIANRLHKTTAQVLLRFNLQRGVVVIPKSVTPSRIESNSKIYDFELSDNDMSEILEMNRDWRVLDLASSNQNKYYPFRENYSED